MSALRKNARWLVALLVATLLGWLSYPFIQRHLLAVRLLQSMAKDAGRTIPSSGVAISDLTFSDGKPILAKAYGPPAESARISIVLAHGIHHHGITEPRLVRFAAHLANLGCRVITPELTDLAHYHITEQGVEALQQSVLYAGRTETPVGLIGFSFAGGLSLLAAQRPDVAKKLRYVASVGGHHDLHRTLRFLATHQVDTPTGRESRRAHEYGLLILVYENLGAFSLGDDEATFRSALLAWLKEDRPLAHQEAARLATARGKDLFTLVQTEQVAELAPMIVAILDERREWLQLLSPRGTLASLETEVILLHGAGDRVVPPEESLFARAELQTGRHPNHRVLVTPLLEHVHVEERRSYQEEVALVRLIARLM
jgi:pimeloyl-ACP methyl ester carboxylesterase